MDIDLELGRFLFHHGVADAEQAKAFAQSWQVSLVSKGTDLARQDETAVTEFILLDGQAASLVLGRDGHAACIGLYAAPCVITPQIARARGGSSISTLTLLTDGLIAAMDSSDLTDLMLQDATIRDWANAVLRQELTRKADREWCLSALNGEARLAWFRDRYPGYEDTFTHGLIASFLGMTPVTLSRLRKKAPLS